MLLKLYNLYTILATALLVWAHESLIFEMVMGT